MINEFTNPKLTVAGIQTGLGNLYGFQQAGFDPLWLIDDRKHYKTSLKTGLKTIKYNFKTMEFSKDPNSFIDKKPLVLLTSPSCAQISRLGTKRADRAELHTFPLEKFDFIQALAEVFSRETDFIITEYLSNTDTYFIIRFNGIEQVFTGEFLEFPPEYRVQILTLNTLDFGVPQKRIRRFVIFSKSKYDFFYQHDKTKKLNPKTIATVLAEVEENRKAGLYVNDKIPTHSKKREEGFSKLAFDESYYGSSNNRRLHPDRVCRVITSHLTQYVHPFEPRVLSTYECAAFQGFPVEFQFLDSISVNLDFIGKSVSPVITREIASQIIKQFEFLSGEEYAGIH